MMGMMMIMMVTRVMMMMMTRVELKHHRWVKARWRPLHCRYHHRITVTPLAAVKGRPVLV